ncbi:MAG: triose-phosphate isomerase [Candidatus Bilamarchaeaceae archaeon]
MIILNLKEYAKSIEKAPYFTDVVSEAVKETGVRIVVCPPVVRLKECAERYEGVFAQHTDPVAPGAFTGSVSAESVKSSGARGSLVNHSERRVGMENVKRIVERLHQNGMESLVCVENPKEALEVAALKPAFIAIEPPELIGSGKSVTKMNPKIVEDTVKAVEKFDDRITVLCGAGVSNRGDTEGAVKLGAKGVLLASAFVNAEDPKKFLQDLASVF